MTKKFYSNIKNQILFFIFLYLSLLISFYLGEDSTGGAFLDYNNQREVINQFIDNFSYALLNYDNLEYTTRHSPVLLMMISLLVKLNFTDEFIRLIYLHLNLILPLFFFKCLKLKFNKIENYYLLLLTGIIFLSPTFRTLAIWPDSRILGLSVFIISIYYFLKFLDNNSEKNIFLNIFFCALASYISPNFSLFAIYFFYSYLKNFGLLSKELTKVILLNIILALPALYYVFYLDILFFFAKATVSFEGPDKLFVNYYNQILIVSSIIFFYLTPFIFTRIIELNEKNNNWILIIFSSIIILISIRSFNYNIDFSGGGIIFHISQFFFKNDILFYIFSFVSIFFILKLIDDKFNNILLFLIIFLGNPQTTIYHKYYDPLLLITFLTLFDFKIKIKIIGSYKSYIFIYIYFAVFLLMNNLKYLL